jgi:hypothetical protein
MDLDKVREFKEEARTIINDELWQLAILEGGRPWRCPPALGIHPASKDNYQLAIRLRREEDLPDRALERLQEKALKANTSLDVRIIGRVQFLNSKPQNFQQHKIRPLCIGASIGQLPTSLPDRTGTLGGFVRERGSSKLFLLSNSHVIAYPEAISGQSVIQPSCRHGGTPPRLHC